MEVNGFDLLGLLTILGVVWLWLDSLKVREMAVREARTVCAAEDLLLLDDTVSIEVLGLARDAQGVWRLRRAYGFEYSDTGNDRYRGSVVMHGDAVLVVNLGSAETSDGQ